jgi:hypothetical protein
MDIGMSLFRILPAKVQLWSVGGCGLCAARFVEEQNEVVCGTCIARHRHVWSDSPAGGDLQHGSRDGFLCKVRPAFGLMINVQRKRQVPLRARTFATSTSR